MNQHTAYAIGKFGEAYYLLAIGPEEIRKRLIVVAGKVLTIRPDMVPEEISADVKWIHDQFSKKETIEKSIRGRHLSTCEEIAKRIIDIYCKLKQLNSTNYSPENNSELPVNIEINFSESG